LNALRLVAGFFCVCLLLLAVLLLLVAPLPQVISLLRWCRAQGWPAGTFVFTVAIISIAMALWGLWRGNLGASRAGLVLFLAVILGVATHSCFIGGDWRVILPLTVACTLSLCFWHGTLGAIIADSRIAEADALRVRN
jgi:hypothetical protein